MVFTPTFLYVKQHKITGLLYFGKHCGKNPVKYLGSGKHWKSHIKKHGKEHVETLWYCLFTELDTIFNFAINFSQQENIVESKLWANLKLESGLDGGSSKGECLGKGRGLALYKNDKNEYIKVANNDPRVLSGEYKLNNFGTSVYILQDGSHQRLRTDDPRVLSGEAISSVKGNKYPTSGAKISKHCIGKSIYRNVETGKLEKLLLTDVRIKSGEYVHQSVGKKATAETKVKYKIRSSGENNPSYGTKMYNNGVINKRFKLGSDIPQEWILGQLRK